MISQNSFRKTSTLLFEAGMTSINVVFPGQMTTSQIVVFPDPVDKISLVYSIVFVFLSAFFDPNGIDFLSVRVRFSKWQIAVVLPTPTWPIKTRSYFSILSRDSI
jgi:hypothetical protein